MSSPNYYELLNIKPTSTLQEIQNAGRNARLKISQKYHGQGDSDNLAKDEYQQIDQAMSVLQDPVARKYYDQLLERYASNPREITEGTHAILQDLQYRQTRTQRIVFFTKDELSQVDFANIRDKDRLIESLTKLGNSDQTAVLMAQFIRSHHNLSHLLVKVNGILHPTPTQRQLASNIHSVNTMMQKRETALKIANEIIENGLKQHKGDNTDRHKIVGEIRKQWTQLHHRVMLGKPLEQELKDFLTYLSTIKQTVSAKNKKSGGFLSRAGWRENQLALAINKLMLKIAETYHLQMPENIVSDARSWSFFNRKQSATAPTSETHTTSTPQQPTGGSSRS